MLWTETNVYPNVECKGDEGGGWRMIAAEIGINFSWDNLTDRLKMVADTGCLWMKFQLFTRDQVPEKFHDLVMDYDDVQSIKDRCWKLGLAPIFTPMYPKAVAWCNQGHIKIRYKDKADSSLVNKAKQFAHHVWISGDLNYSNQVLCIPKYPATRMDYIKKMIPWHPENNPDGYKHHPVGISFHCPDITLLTSPIPELEIMEKEQKWTQHHGPYHGFYRYEPNHYIEYHVKFSDDDYEAKWSIGMDDLKKLVEWESR